MGRTYLEAQIHYWIAHFHPPDGCGEKSSSNSKRKVYIITGAGHGRRGTTSSSRCPLPADSTRPAPSIQIHHIPTRPGARVRAGVPPACLCLRGLGSASARRLPAPRAPPREGSPLPRSPSPAARRPAPLSSPLPPGSSPATVAPSPTPSLPRDTGGAPAPLRWFDLNELIH